MCINRSITIIFLLGFFSVLIVADDYTDSREGMLGMVPFEGILELYRLILEQAALENDIKEIPQIHLMTDEPKRLPSLRLRFGRSGSPQ